MRLLGAILCGGRSSRFGSDKATALLEGVALAEHVHRALAPQVDAVVACGRPLAGLEGLPDRPEPGLGPLGGLAAALHAGLGRGFDAVLSVPCDTPFLPADLATRLGQTPPAYAAELPVIGFWPCALAPLLDLHLVEDERRSMRGWAARAQAHAVAFGPGLANVNRPEDMARLTRRAGYREFK